MKRYLFLCLIKLTHVDNAEPDILKEIVKTCGTHSLRIQAPFPMIACLLSVQFVRTLRRDVSRKTAKAGVRAGSERCHEDYRSVRYKFIQLKC